MKKSIVVIGKILDILYYIGAVMFLLGNIALWGEKGPILDSFWTGLSICIILFCVLTFIVYRTIKWAKTKKRKKE